MTADGVTVRHSVPFVRIAHVLVVLFHYEWFHGMSMFITEITFYRWIVYVGQYVNVTFVSPYHSGQVTPCPCPNVTPFQF
jgi:hypothetical protein